MRPQLTSTQESFGGFAVQNVKRLDSRLTFLVQALLLVQDDELAVLVRLLQDVLALLDVAVVVLQAQQRRNQGHVGLQPNHSEQFNASVYVKLLNTANELLVDRTF